MQFNPGDVIHAQVTKGDILQEAGLELEEYHGRYYVKKVKGLFKRRNVPVQVGDQLLKLNGRDVDDYRNLKEMKQLMKDEMSIQICYMRTDPEDDTSEYDSEEEQPETYQTIEYPSTHGGSNVNPGDIMMLEGLKSKPELNGLTVKVLEEAETPGRWQVETRSSKVVLSAKEENLVPVDYDIDSYADGESDEEETVLQLGYGIEPGMTMKLYKLKKKAKMNGTHVQVVKEASSSRPGRWEVRVLETNQIMSIAEDNLKPV